MKNVLKFFGAILGMSASVILSSCQSGVSINTQGADALINWMLSNEGMNHMTGSTGYKEGKLFTALEGHPTSTKDIPNANNSNKDIRISTTTSVNDSGLLNYVLPIFEEKYGYNVEVYSAGTGKAINNAKYGNADLILVHAKSQEEQFVSDGFARKVDGYDSERLSFMYNYFVLIGPESNPAGIEISDKAKDAFKKISDGKYKFISRGDNSGTHTKEISLWDKSLEISTEHTSFEKYSDWYSSANAGMAVCLGMAEENDAYILSDKATFLTYKENHPSTKLNIVKEEDDDMKNTYTLIAVNDKAEFTVDPNKQ